MSGVSDDVINEAVETQNFTSLKVVSVENNSQKGILNPQRPACPTVHSPNDGLIDTSIDKLYESLCDLQSSEQSTSRHSFGSDGEESLIDSELHHLVGGDEREVEMIREEAEETKTPAGNTLFMQKSSSLDKMSAKMDKNQSVSAKSVSSTPLRNEKNLKKQNRVKKQQNSLSEGLRSKNGIEDSDVSGLDNPDVGPYLLKQARDLVSSGENLQKALELALRAVKSFESCADKKNSLELVMCLHATAAIYCSLGRYSEAIPLLEHSIEIPSLEESTERALANFAGQMQLGDTYAMLGQLDNLISCYTKGLEIQKRVLGGNDIRVSMTCRCLSEAHVQALQFDEAEKICQMALDIHKQNGATGSLEEAADRRLMGLICETKGDQEAALEHLVLASMAMVANGREMEVASVDCSIGDIYSSLSRYGEAVFAYQKALTVFKTTKGENHPAVASVFVRLADLCNKTGKIRESKSYIENALRIYENPIGGVRIEEIAFGLADLSAIYESMNEHDKALQLLTKALSMYDDSLGQRNAIAGIEAQMGVIYYILGNYSESYNSLERATSKLRSSGDKKSAFFGIAINQMGLACVQCRSINEGVELFIEAKNILEQEYGPYHPDTLGVYCNLAAAYDAIGRLDDAIETLEYVVRTREETVGTANPDVDDEKKRLNELLKEAGKVRNKRGRSLEILLGSNSRAVDNDNDNDNDNDKDNLYIMI